MRFSYGFFGVEVAGGVVVLGVVPAAAPVLFSLNRLSGVPSFFKCCGGGVLFSLKRLSGVPSFFKWVVVVVVAAGLGAGVVCAMEAPAKINNILAINAIFFIFWYFSVIER
jgi:hypothetical protein